ncbi:hypothetical protein DFH09DRAFT_1464725, partial [Mycena vulgaris]
MDGTRVDIIKDIVTRLTAPPNPSERIVMLSGPAGSGKSTIAKSVASILAEEKGILAASFFFSRDYTERNEIKHLPTTLAFQLSDYNVLIRTSLIDLLETDQTGILDVDPHLQFQKMIVEILEQMPLSPTPWVICLDALDECGKERGQLFLRWLSDSISQIPAHIRFLLTGRPDVPSYLKFDTLLSFMHGIILNEIDGTAVSDDICLYVKQSLDGANWTTRHPWKIQSKDVDEITNRASGLFVFAATAVRYILSGLPQVQPQESVDYLLGGEPLTDLNALYQRIVNEAIPVPPPGDRRAQDSHDRAIRILSSIFHLLEPLDADSLAALLELDTDVLQETLLPLSAVIHGSDTPGTDIQIIHLSFREFMTSHVKMTRPELCCDTEDQQLFLSSALMKFMHKELRFNICDLPTSYLRHKDIPDFELRVNTYIPLDLEYACRYWVDHLVATTYSPDTAKVAEELLSKQFLFWLEVLSLLGIVDVAKSLSKLIAWAKKSEEQKNTTLVVFATDAQTFISFFRNAIIDSAPHIYISALALAPTQSKISQTFRPLFPNLLSIAIGQSTEWPDTLLGLEGHPKAFHSSLEFSPDDKYIVSRTNGAVSGIWDAESGAVLDGPLENHTNLVPSITFLPNGRRITANSNDTSAGTQDPEKNSGELWEDHLDWVNSVSLSPNSKFTVSGSDDNTVHIWNAETGAALGTPLEGHTDCVRSVMFSPDNRHIVSGS